MYFRRCCFAMLLLMMLFSGSRETEDDNLALRVFIALDGVLKFINENIDDMNVDGMYGVVLSEAHLRSIPSPDFRPEFKHLISLTSQMISKFKKKHHNASSRNQMFMVHLLNVELWMRDTEFVSDQLEGESIVDRQSCPQYLDSLANMHFSEELSDNCLLDLIVKTLNGKHDCLLEDECASFLCRKKHLPGYGITHKLLLVQTSQALKCKWDPKWSKKKIVNFCTKIYRESMKLESCNFPSTLDDLFMEQIVLCGYEGFEEFMCKNWIEHVLSIQSCHGCFGTFTSSSVFRKREANLIKHNCIDHTSGLGAAVLSLFLRYLTVTQKGGEFPALKRYRNFKNDTFA